MTRASAAPHVECLHDAVVELHRQLQEPRVDPLGLHRLNVAISDGFPYNLKSTAPTETRLELELRKVEVALFGRSVDDVGIGFNVT